MAVSRKRSRNLTLPWEFRGYRFFGMFSRRNWRAVALLLGAVAAAFLFLREVSFRDDVHETLTAVREGRLAVQRFRRDRARCPRSNRELLSPPGMQTPYLREIPRDAWGKKLYLKCPGHFAEIDVVSAGPSGSFFEDDNIF